MWSLPEKKKESVCLSVCMYLVRGHGALGHPTYQMASGPWQRAIWNRWIHGLSGSKSVGAPSWKHFSCLCIYWLQIQMLTTEDIILDKRKRKKVIDLRGVWREKVSDDWVCVKSDTLYRKFFSHVLIVRSNQTFMMVGNFVDAKAWQKKIMLKGKDVNFSPL